MKRAKRAKRLEKALESTLSIPIAFPKLLDEETAESLMSYIPSAPPLRSTTSQQKIVVSTTTTATGNTTKTKSIFS